MNDSVHSVVLPWGFQVRPPTIQDLPTVFNLLTAWDMTYLGTPDTVLEDLQEEWEEIDLAHDAFLVLAPDGQLAGVATVTGPTTMQIRAAVHPKYDQSGIAAYLRHLTEIRAYQRAREMHGQSLFSLATWISSRQEAERQLLYTLGYTLRERYSRMRIDMDAPPPEPEWPEQIIIRTAIANQDERAVYEVLEAANYDVPRHEPIDYADWHRLMVDTYRYDPSLWWLAVEGNTLVGAALGVQFPDVGWVRLVGVRPAWRQRGIATALLRSAFGAFWRRGYTRVELGVDPDSTHGAQRIYQSAGMRMVFELAKYQKELRQAEQ